MIFISDFEVDDIDFRLYYEVITKMFVIENHRTKDRKPYTAQKFANIIGKYLSEGEMIHLNRKIKEMV